MINPWVECEFFPENGLFCGDHVIWHESRSLPSTAYLEITCHHVPKVGLAAVALVVVYREDMRKRLLVAGCWGDNAKQELIRATIRLLDEACEEASKLPLAQDERNE